MVGRPPTPILAQSGSITAARLASKNLPPELHDGSIESWSAAIEARDRRKRDRSRRTATTVLVILFVLIVVVPVPGLAATLLG